MRLREVMLILASCWPGWAFVLKRCPVARYAALAMMVYASGVPHPFEYHSPSSTQAAVMVDINLLFKAAYERMMELVPENAERTLAIRKLQEARMWTNAAILMLDQ